MVMAALKVITCILIAKLILLHVLVTSLIMLLTMSVESIVLNNLI